MPIIFILDSSAAEVDLNLANRIALRCIALAPELTNGKGIEHLDIVRNNIGLRPARHGGSRLEVEHMEWGLVVHNYGAGGAGFQSSWGMATKAAELLEASLKAES